MHTASREVDVLIISDLRFPGGTSQSIAAEIEAQAAAGYRTGLVQVNAELVHKVAGVNPAIAALVRAGKAELLVGSRAISTRVTVIRHPAVLHSAAGNLPPIDTEHLVILPNTGTTDTAGRSVYDVSTVDRLARAEFGIAPLWAPIGPLVRSQISDQVPAGRLMSTDWVNIIDVDQWQRERPAKAADRPIVGRHSRSSPQKWPRDAETIRAVYPVDGTWEVRILGGAEPAAQLLGGMPKSWQVLEFGAVEPAEFLAGLDFFIYYHDPRWVEAFGRTILEALASGIPAVLPPHFRPLFADSAIYAEPHQVRSIVESLWRDRAAYDAHVKQAAAVVRERFSYQTHVRRIGKLIGPPSQQHRLAGGCQSPEPSHDSSADQSPAASVSHSHSTHTRPRVLLVSSNGTGMGHLTRLFSYARRLTPAVEPYFLSLSQAVPIAGQLGYPYEYLPSARALEMPPARWTPMFIERVSDTIARVSPDVVIFDGTWPYNGIEQIRERHPRPRWVWSRRGMWRQGANVDQVNKAAWFDLVIEPGDLAAERDHGATSTAPAKRVGPVTLLDRADLHDSAEARAALGLPAEGPLALVSLGAGNINDTSRDLGRAAVELSKLGVGVCVTVPEIAASSGTSGLDVHLVRDYPLSRRFAAFDLMISASGYNSFHEAMRFGVPSLFVPNAATSLDDQVARAQYAEDQGWAHSLASLGDKRTAAVIDDLLTRGHEMAARAQVADPGNGAVEAAELIRGLIGEAAQ